MHDGWKKWYSVIWEATWKVDCLQYATDINQVKIWNHTLLQLPILQTSQWEMVKFFTPKCDCMWLIELNTRVPVLLNLFNSLRKCEALFFFPKRFKYIQ